MEGHVPSNPVPQNVISESAFFGLSCIKYKLESTDRSYALYCAKLSIQDCAPDSDKPESDVITKEKGLLHFHHRGVKPRRKEERIKI